MVPPRFETWLLEGRLRPYVHYVPLAPDFSDIPDKVGKPACRASRVVGAGWVTVHS